MNTALKFVRRSLSIGALELLPEGRKLKSGRLSPYFFNSALFKVSRNVAFLGDCYAQTLIKFAREIEYRIDTVYGPAYKGIPLAALTTAFLEFETKLEHVTFAFNRKEPKDHGEGGLIVGDTLRDKRVLIVDDVITSGSSIDEAVEIIRSEGGIPVGCVVAFDRDERVSEEVTTSARGVLSKKHGFPIVAIATVADLITVLSEEEDPESHKTLNKILEYRTQYKSLN